MVSIKTVMAALEPRAIGQRIGRKHDNFLLTYHVKNPSPRTFAEYIKTLGDYYGGHFSVCVAGGGEMSPARAQEEAKSIIQRQYERRDEDIVGAYNDVVDSVNGGLGAHLQMIRDALKHQDMEMEINHILDTYFPPGGAGAEGDEAYRARLELVTQFCARYGDQLADSIDIEHPERYANREFKVVIRAYVEALDRAGKQFRRL